MNSLDYIYQLTDEDELVRLSDSSDEYELLAILRNTYTPEHILVKFARGSNERIARQALRESRFPLAVACEILESNCSISIACAAASHPEIPTELLLKLAKERTEDIVIGELINHRNSTYAVVEAALLNTKIVPDQNYPRIGFLVLSEKKTTTNETLELIYKHLPGCAYGIAYNNNAGPSLLTKIVLAHFDDSINLSEEDGRQYVLAMREVAKHKNAEPATLELLSKHPDVWVRTKVAWNPNTPTFVLVELSKDPEAAVRKAVGKNKNTPDFVLTILENDKSKPVKAAVAHNKLKNSRP